MKISIHSCETRSAAVDLKSVFNGYNHSYFIVNNEKVLVIVNPREIIIKKNRSNKKLEVFSDPQLGCIFYSNENRFHN